MHLFIVFFDERVISVSVFELGEVPVAHLQSVQSGDRQQTEEVITSACNGGVIYVNSYLSRLAQVLGDHYEIDKSLRIVTVL